VGEGEQPDPPPLNRSRYNGKNLGEEFFRFVSAMSRQDFFDSLCSSKEVYTVFLTFSPLSFSEAPEVYALLGMRDQAIRSMKKITQENPISKGEARAGQVGLGGTVWEMQRVIRKSWSDILSAGTAALALLGFVVRTSMPYSSN